VSSAKGLALALDVPMVAVPTLECLAMCAKTPARLSIVSLLHARKNEWYAAIYQRVADVTERLLEIRPAAIVSFDEWLSFVERHDDVAVVTDSAGARALLGSNLRLQEVHPHAAAVATIGDRRLETGEIVDLETFEPAYLRDFVARKPKQSIFEKLRF
jgi:tRNA threonylcarbamoyladenosine biosynthesis protein TsaB